MANPSKGDRQRGPWGCHPVPTPPALRGSGSRCFPSRQAGRRVGARGLVIGRKRPTGTAGTPAPRPAVCSRAPPPPRASSQGRCSPSGARPGRGGLGPEALWRHRARGTCPDGDRLALPRAPTRAGEAKAPCRRLWAPKPVTVKLMASRHIKLCSYHPEARSPKSVSRDQRPGIIRAGSLCHCVPGLMTSQLGS